MSEIRVDRIVDSTGNSPVIYLDPSANEVRIGTGITFNTITNQIILGDTVVGDISGNANFSGIVTALAFVGDGSGLTNLPSGGGGTSDWVRTGAGIHTLGNVGVGTTNPKVKLQIDGVLGFGTFTDQFGYSATNIRIGDVTTGSGGYNNIFMGVGAGNSNTTGYFNNFFGAYSGYYNTTGCSNNFLGGSAGYCNTTGGNNNFFGNAAGLSNISGYGNNFFGNSAGYYNTTGLYNNFFGKDAGFCNTTGSGNNFLGYVAGYCNTTGNNNIFLGVEAGYLNTTGSYNNFLGYFAGKLNTTGCQNTYIGHQSGTYAETGCFNTFLGSYSGTIVSAASSIIAIGHAAGYNASVGTRNTFLGSYSGMSVDAGSNSIYIGGFSGLGTGSYKVVIGEGGNRWGNPNNELFDTPYPNKNFQLAVGVRTDANPSKYWLVGDENFNIGIGTTNPTSKLQVGGTVTATAFVGDGSGLTNLPSGGGGTSDWVRTSAGIHTLGNVGVGTTNPQVRLQINGTLGFEVFTGSYGENNYRGVNISIGDTTTGASVVPDPNSGNGLNNIFMGVGAGNSTTFGKYNNFFGNSAGYFNDGGSGNNFLGRYAGFKNDSGTSNNFLGWYAGCSNTNGSNNTFIGWYAGCSNTSGDNNIFIGGYTGTSNTDGFYNIFFGNFSGANNVGGYRNTFIANFAGYNNTTGSENIFFGAYSGYCNTTGTCNSFFSRGTGFNNTVGCYNNFFGWYSGSSNTTGSYNSFFGAKAGTYNETGSCNLFLGTYAGISTSASNKILIKAGYHPFDAPNLDKDTQLAIGIRTSYVTPSRYWLVGDENFNIGIGTTNPSEKLSVGGNISLNQTTVYGSVQASTASTIATGIHSGLSTSVYRSVEYTIQASQGSSHQAIKILAIHDGITAYDTQYGNIYNNEVATFDVDISGGNVRLVAVASSTSTTNYTVNFIATKNLMLTFQEEMPV